MKIINKSRKIISIDGAAFLPGETMELSDAQSSHPAIKRYLAKGVVADAEAASNSAAVSDAERAKIAAEAIEQYKAEAQEAQEALAAEIKAVKSLKKDELITKALAMELDVSDSDTVETLREKIIAALSE